MSEEVQIIKQKPIISYWRSGDPCYKINEIKPLLTDINIINTKHLSPEFVQFCIKYKDRIYLHVNITGMGRTPLEVNIPAVKDTFFQIKNLIENGFSQKQILVIVNPILPNENGLNALKLLLKVFTEFRGLRLRVVKFNLLHYRQLDSNKFVVANNNILNRESTKGIMGFMTKSSSFIKDYYDLIKSYQAIITVDKGDEALIGIRELLPFGYKNEWFVDGKREKLINYQDNNKHKPIVNLLSDKKAVRCKNMCLLCPWLY